MTRAEWDERWWEVFLEMRKKDPTKDMVDTHRAAREYMEKHYGARPAGEPGPPWWMKLGALAIGVPMDFLNKTWKWFSGKKLIIGAIITVVSVIATDLPTVLAAFGASTVLIAKWVGIATTVVGLLHRLYKLLYGTDHE